MEQLEDMLYMTAGLGLFLVALTLLLYTGRCVDVLYENCEHFALPQQMIVEDGYE